MDIIQVAFPSHQNKVIFDYKANMSCAIGDFVVAPFKDKELIGVVWSKDASTIDEAKLREIKQIISSVSFTEKQLKFFKFFSDYNMANIGSVLKLAIPIDKIPDDGDGELANYNYALPSLNSEQEQALNLIPLGCYNVTLLEGVTGSGKTEVYIHAIAKVLNSSSTSQVLVMMPEIMLTHQFVNRFKERFGEAPHLWHSQVSKKEKKRIWGLVARGKARFILGARSSLFLPFKQLELIVLDEEHDSSYKQEEGIVYNARDMAVAYSYFNSSSIILSSATPAIETLYNVVLKKYNRVVITNRYGNNTMPNISIIDMSREKLKKGEWISAALRSKISATLEKGEQVMLFLNRRGYAPITLCTACGYKEKCSNCNAFLVSHKRKKKLMCHYCGYSKPEINACSSCYKVDTLINCGPGVEKIQEEVNNFWPDVKSIIVTRDTINSDKESSEIVQCILDRKVQIIIGTQILSKGFHFPHLNLVGIVDADIGLIGVDLKASERTFQLLNQVSGRAGRESQGEVVIQTYYPDNEILKSLRSHDKQNFYQSEIAERKLVNMPPYQRLAAIILNGTNELKVKKIADELAKAIPYTKGITVLGPAPAPITLLRGRYRYRFLIKSNTDIKVQSYIKHWLASVKTPESIRIKVDIDPYNFM